MVVDDVHWADMPSLRFLGYLARRVHGLPVLLMVAVRPEDPAPTASFTRSAPAA
ncbi:hypothetical protein J7F03_38135 [Streptomyces sp. ISL-43]|uniref:hypothetical protein n=1 Tax=Streptomyces sp. ISL-43 TaxID=2819183 RepID=UPI001BE98327|nr:hypothetical protein [Streptomyces sp. ISL-43]MBT2452757.1 hypothetical protein [Streptomyces sp. ISL-43]